MTLNIRPKEGRFYAKNGLLERKTWPLGTLKTSYSKAKRRLLEAKMRPLGMKLAVQHQTKVKFNDTFKR